MKCSIAACRWTSEWKLTNAQFEREMRKMDDTPPKIDSVDAVEESVVDEDATGPAGALCVDCAPADCAPVDDCWEPGEGGELKNRQSSSCVASEGTFPAHMTHSERCAGGLGWYGRRTGGGRSALCWLLAALDIPGDTGILSGGRPRC